MCYHSRSKSFKEQTWMTASDTSRYNIICYSLKNYNYPYIISQNCLKSSIFPDDWKMGNIMPVHKKNSKQLVNKYFLCHCYLSDQNLCEAHIHFQFHDQNNLFNIFRFWSK